LRRQSSLICHGKRQEARGSAVAAHVTLSRSAKLSQWVADWLSDNEGGKPMPTLPASRSEERRNGHPTIGPQANTPAESPDEMEPKGMPNADRYRAETAHVTETHDPAKTKKKHRDD
jgi:hypothetical protein